MHPFVSLKCSEFPPAERRTTAPVCLAENWRSLDQGRQMDAAKRFLRWNRDQRASPELLGLLIGAGYAGKNVL